LKKKKKDYRLNFFQILIIMMKDLYEDIDLSYYDQNKELVLAIIRCLLIIDTLLIGISNSLEDKKRANLYRGDSDENLVKYLEIAVVFKEFSGLIMADLKEFIQEMYKDDYLNYFSEYSLKDISSGDLGNSLKSEYII
jgi:hypothetical protein